MNLVRRFAADAAALLLSAGPVAGGAAVAAKVVAVPTAVAAVAALANSCKGGTGLSAFEEWQTLPGNEGKTWEEYQEEIRGRTGPQGPQGPAGQSSYDLAVKEGYTGTLDQYLASLQGIPGVQGPQGAQGPAGVGVNELLALWGAAVGDNTPTMPEFVDWLMNNAGNGGNNNGGTGGGTTGTVEGLSYLEANAFRTALVEVQKFLDTSAVPYRINFAVRSTTNDVSGLGMALIFSDTDEPMNGSQSSINAVVVKNFEAGDKNILESVGDYKEGVDAVTTIVNIDNAIESGVANQGSVVSTTVTAFGNLAYQLADFNPAGKTDQQKADALAAGGKEIGQAIVTLLQNAAANNVNDPRNTQGWTKSDSQFAGSNVSFKPALQIAQL